MEVVAHAHNLITQEPEARGELQVQGRPEFHSETLTQNKQKAR